MNEYTREEYVKIYNKIYDILTTGVEPDSEKCTIVLGGQPGAGKSTFYEMKEDLNRFIAINGDNFRRYHPYHSEIIKYDPESYAERTQAFANSIVENLIDDLGAKGYNLIIEGTLRNPNVPIRTCKSLQEKGYDVNLVVVACDAEKSWESTIYRAKRLKEQGLVPRLVPIDIYNRTVHQIDDSLKTIEENGCFKNIIVLNREGKVLFNSDISKGSACEYLRKELNIENWDNKFQYYEKAFFQEKINILQSKLSDMKEVNEKIVDDYERE